MRLSALPLVLIVLRVAFNQKCAVCSIILEPSLIEINAVVIVITWTVRGGWRGESNLPPRCKNLTGVQPSAATVDSPTHTPPLHVSQLGHF